MQQLNKTELIALVEKLMRAEGSPEEQVVWLTILERNVPHPNISDLMFWPNLCGLDHNPSAEEIIDIALSYKPIQL